MFGSGNSGEKQLQDSRTTEIRKCVRSYNKQMKSLEFSRLRSLVPATASRPRVSKIEVIEEAIKYIAYLQATLSSRFEEPSESNNNSVAVEQTEGERRPKILRQKRKRFASYMIKTQRHTLPARRKFSSRSTIESEKSR